MLKFFSRWRDNCVALALLLTFLFFSLLQTGALADNPHPSQYRLTPKIYKGRVIAPAMSHLGADWLEREEREHLEQPEKVLDVLKIASGSIVADIGAGTGYQSTAHQTCRPTRTSARHGHSTMLVRLRLNMKKADISKIEPILCTSTCPRLCQSHEVPIFTLDRAGNRFYVCRQTKPPAFRITRERLTPRSFQRRPQLVSVNSGV